MKTLLLFLTFSYAFVSVTGQTATTSTSDMGDGGPCDKAILNVPVKAAIDANGNIYIVDKKNNRIRKVDSKTFIITTVAGNGVPGYSGDNGVATQAELNSPSDIVLDKSGNIYIADIENNRIRKVNALTGVITTIAGTGEPYKFGGDGGPATAAQIYSPCNLTIDASGNIYISDLNNYRIRKITASAGIITTIAGIGRGGLTGDGGPATSARIEAWALALDSKSNIYFADNENHVIRKIDAATGIINTVVGGAGTWLDKQSKVYDFDWDKWYDDSRGSKATSIDIARGPYGLALDNVGNLYFTTGSANIYGITADGNIAEAKKGFTQGFAVSSDVSITGITNDTNNDLYIANTGDNIIFKIDYSTGITVREAGQYFKRADSGNDEGW